MHEVEELSEGWACKTRVWLADAALKDFEHYAKTENPRGRLIKKLKQYATNGFELYEGKKKPIRPEWDGVFRIGERSSLFRLIGFYEDGSKAAFIVVRCFMKSGQSLGAAERAIIDAVAKVKKTVDWKRKKKSHGDYPRIVK